MPHTDLTGLTAEKTLSFTIKNNKGEVVRWEVPPFDNETEHAFWAWSDKMFEQRRIEQEYDMGLLRKDEEQSEKPERSTTLETWAPLVALAVKKQGPSEDSMADITLQDNELIANYSAPILSAVGAEIAHFFHIGKTLAEEKAELEVLAKKAAELQSHETTGSTTSAS